MSLQLGGKGGGGGREEEGQLIVPWYFYRGTWKFTYAAVWDLQLLFRAKHAHTMHIHTLTHYMVCVCVSVCVWFYHLLDKPWLEAGLWAWVLCPVNPEWAQKREIDEPTRQLEITTLTLSTMCLFRCCCCHWALLPLRYWPHRR